MIDEWLTTPLKIIGASAAGTAVLGLVIRFVIALASRGRVDGARDKAEVDFYKILREENQMLRQHAATAYKERDEAIARESQAVSRVGGLEWQVKSLTEQVQHLNLRVEELMQQMQERGKGGEQWPT